MSLAPGLTSSGPEDNGGTAQPARQVAALVWRPGPTEADILLVTSRTSRRWLIPRGWPIEGKSDDLSALQEAFEEAGVYALRTDAMVGTYQYTKGLGDGSLLPCAVDVFAIRSPRLLDAWPEMWQRERRWYGVEAAAAQVTEPALSDLLRSFGAALVRDVTGVVTDSHSVPSRPPGGGG